MANPRYIWLRIGEPVELRLAGEFEEVEREFHDGTKYTRYECHVETLGGEGDTLSVGPMTMQTIQDLFDFGFPEDGWYRIVRQGFGICTRYSVVPLRWTPDGRSQHPDDNNDVADDDDVKVVPRWLRRLVGCDGGDA